MDTKKPAARKMTGAVKPHKEMAMGKKPKVADASLPMKKGGKVKAKKGC